MGVTPEEARDALSQIEDTIQRTKRMLAYAGADTLLIVWGIVWVIGHLSTFLLPVILRPETREAARVVSWAISSVWIMLVAVAIAISVLVGRRRTPARSPLGARIGLFWWLLYGYVALWVSLLWPFLRVEGHQQSLRFFAHWGAIAATVPMFAYVMMGLWLDLYLLWIGLAVTGLTLAGLFLFQPYFWLWMAFAGGGTLIGTGVFIQRKWR